ncbi:MAG TPA: TolC family protein [Porphyromonadaceae bacterium]|nr:TolC family protein [Porphyromonadaceae bacterium]
MDMRKYYFICLLALQLFANFPFLYAQQTLTLEACREMALKENKKIRMAQNERQTAALIKRTAMTHYLPKINFGGGYMRTGSDIKLLENDLFLPAVPYNTIDPQTGRFNPEALKDPATAMNTLVLNPQTGAPVTDASGNPVFKNYAMLPADKLVLERKNLYYAGFSVMQPLFTGFKITEANRIARRAENISGKNVLLVKAETIVKTDEAFWRVVSLQEKVKLAHSYEKLLDQLVTDLLNMHGEGIITRNDLLKAQVKQNESKLKTLEAENGLALSKMALAQIIGLQDTGIEVAPGTMEEAPLRTDSLMPPDISPENRAEISMLKEKVGIMESNKNIERAKFMPDIALAGSYGWMNPNPYDGLKEEFGGDWSVGVVVKIPVFTWGERKYELNAAKLKKQKAQLELDEAREMIDLQIRRSRYQYAEALKKAEMAKLSKEQAAENMRVTKDNLREGISRLSELLEAQTQWESASSTYIDALVEVKTTRLELEKSTGQIYRYVP